MGLVLFSENTKKKFELFLSLVRALFPRWDFFDQIAYSFELQYSTDQQSWTELAFHQKQRRWINFFINPEVNLSLAQMNVIEHFARDVQELQTNKMTPAVSELTSYKLVASMLSTHVSIRSVRKKDSIHVRVLAQNPEHQILIFYFELKDF